jgi:hypothetical protein
MMVKRVRYFKKVFGVFVFLISKKKYLKINELIEMKSHKKGTVQIQQKLVI